MVVDPDIRIRGRDEGSSIDLERFVSDFQQSGAAAVCPRIMIEPDGFLARFQAFEYALAFRVGRASLADFSITSGVSLYRRDALAARAGRAFAVGLRRGFRECGHSAQSGRADLLRWPPGRQHRRPGLVAALVLAARRLVPRAAQGLHRALSAKCCASAAVRRSPSTTIMVYFGGLSLALHLVKIVSAVLLLVSFAERPRCTAVR